MDSARALIARGWGVSFVSRCLRVSRAQLHVILRRADDWKDGRRSRHTDDTDVLRRIHHGIGELPTYGYRRVWALLRRQTELDGMPAINAKRVYRIMRQNALLLERKPAVPPSKRAHTGRVAVKESNQRWCPFQITLSECSKGTTGVRVAFNGIEDAENNTLLKLDEGSNTASGLGIEILDGNMRPVKLNDLHAEMQWIPLVPEQNNILPYSARLKSTQKSVNPGLVSASATFTLEFQ